MTSAQFKVWRKALGLKQKEAADRLGLKKRMIQYYETGRRQGKGVVIPKTVELACYALSVGVLEYDGGLAVVPDSGSNLRSAGVLSMQIPDQDAA